MAEEIGPIIRLSPNDVDVCDIAAAKTIYNIRETFHKSDFYTNVTTSNAEYIDEQDGAVRVRALASGATFVPVQQLPVAMRDHIARAATETWVQWIEQTERNGHPARATAVISFVVWFIVRPRPRGAAPLHAAVGRLAPKRLEAKTVPRPNLR